MEMVCREETNIKGGFRIKATEKTVLQPIPCTLLSLIHLYIYATTPDTTTNPDTTLP